MNRSRAPRNKKTAVSTTKHRTQSAPTRAVSRSISSLSSTPAHHVNSRRSKTSRLNVSSSRSMSTVVVADHSTTQPVARSLISAASAIGKDIKVVVVAPTIPKQLVDDIAVTKGVSKVLTVEADANSPEVMAFVAQKIQVQENATHILAPSTASGKSWIPRFAAKVDVQSLSDVIKVVSEDTFVRPTYAGNAINTVKTNDPIKVLTVRASSFDKVAANNDSPVPVEAITIDTSSLVRSTFVSSDIVKSDRPDLSTARVVISGGRGLKSGDNFKMLYDLADKLGGAVGASRAAVDAGFVSNDLQVGQTGKVVAPDLYIAAGISGAIQHLAGMKDSKTIVAINKDADAPIFQVADFGLVADLFEVVPEITEKVKH